MALGSSFHMFERELADAGPNPSTVSRQTLATLCLLLLLLQGHRENVGHCDTKWDLVRGRCLIGRETLKRLGCPLHHQRTMLGGRIAFRFPQRLQ